MRRLLATGAPNCIKFLFFYKSVYLAQNGALSIGEYLSWAFLPPPPPLPPLIQSFSSIHFDRSSFAMFQFSELFCIIHPHTKPAPKSDVISPQRNPLKKTTAYNSFHFAFQECHSRAFSSQLPPPPCSLLLGNETKKNRRSASEFSGSGYKENPSTDAAAAAGRPKEKHSKIYW